MKGTRPERRGSLQEQASKHHLRLCPELRLCDWTGLSAHHGWKTDSREPTCCDWPNMISRVKIGVMKPTGRIIHMCVQYREMSWRNWIREKLGLQKQPKFFMSHLSLVERSRDNSDKQSNPFYTNPESLVHSTQPSLSLTLSLNCWIASARMSSTEVYR
jgi:hypothetical protein